jgi:hypothetical protein
VSGFEEMDEETADLNERVGDEVPEDAGGGGEAGEPAPAPAAAPAPAPAPQVTPWQGHPLAPMAERLPAGLKHLINTGQRSIEEAVVQHYGSKRWSDLVQNETRSTQEIQRLQQQNQVINQRLGVLMKQWSRYADTIGLEPLPEEQPPAPPDPLQELHGKVDQVLALEDDRRVEAVVEQVQTWVQDDIAQIYEVEPEYDAAQEFVSNELMSFEIGRAQEALHWWSTTKDPQYLRAFSPEYLQAVVSGQMTEEELVTKTGLERAMAVVAQIQHRHYAGRTSVAQEVLEIARKKGWQPSRDGGPAPAYGAQPVAAQQPLAPRQPAPARPDPNLARLRTQVPYGQPAPANRAYTPSPDEMASRIANMDQGTFDQMMDELVQSGQSPDEAFRQMLRLTGAS